MTLKEKIGDVYINNDMSKNLEKIADDYAIEFAEWNSHKYKYLENKGWFATSYQLGMDILISSKELLEIFKKEKGL